MCQLKKDKVNIHQMICSNTHIEAKTHVLVCSRYISSMFFKVCFSKYIYI